MVMPAPRLYGSSKKEALVDAVAAVRGGMSIRQASEEFDIRKSTLHGRVKNLHAKEPGRPCELDGATEKTLAELVDVVAEWGYPGRIRDQDDGPELPRHQGRSFGSLPEQLSRRSLTEGVRQEVPERSVIGNLLYWI